MSEAMGLDETFLANDFRRMSRPLATSLLRRGQRYFSNGDNQSRLSTNFPHHTYSSTYIYSSILSCCYGNHVCALQSPPLLLLLEPTPLSSRPPWQTVSPLFCNSNFISISNSSIRHKWLSLKEIQRVSPFVLSVPCFQHSKSDSPNSLLKLLPLISALLLSLRFAPLWLLISVFCKNLLPKLPHSHIQRSAPSSI